uniref:DISC1 scaffold protein n=1 Tax=Tetraodon nigroviridis TaxID=99883 RepID=H3C121_TETNG
MFAGLMGIECHSSSARHRCGVAEGGRASGTAGGSARKRLHRRPGYTRAEQSRLHAAGRTFGTGKSGLGADVSQAHPAQRMSGTPAGKLSSQQEPDGPPCGSWKAPSLLRHPSSSSPGRGGKETFTSSFSFIQQSLRSAETPASQEPEPPPPQPKPPAQLLPSGEDPPPGQSFWQRCPWDARGVPPHPPDCDSVDTEVTSSQSVDSDNASASSVTSGYDSATPASDQGWDSLLRKHQVVLQDCLHNNRTFTKIESMMLKLRRLQQKAILDDDYDAVAERFGKKLEELSGERGALKLGPSTQPSVALFLQRLRQAANSALQRPDCGQFRASPDAAEQRDALPGPLHRRDKLIQKRKLVEEEIAELQQRLAELMDRSRCLQQQIQQEEHQAEAEELESSLLRSCTPAQLRGLSQALHDLASSESRRQISVLPSASKLRLQEQEQELNLAIKEATAKVVMSQRLGSSLRRKVSETETQLLALHEAKLAAISGNDFGSAKELKVEMKPVYQERERLEALAKRLQRLSSGSGQELVRMKEQRQQLREELEQKEARHDTGLMRNTTKYIKLLEDTLRSCVCPGLERIWEADLEACHLFLRGLQLRTPSYGSADVEELPSAEGYPPSEPPTKEDEEEEDCAMLTALGGRWGPEANLQNSAFTKKLEEFLFGMEENHAEDAFNEAEATALTEHCELIGVRLMTLEDELHAAMLNEDQALTHSLEKEVQDVKATLQTMLAQLKGDEEEEELQEHNLMRNRNQYFSDSWDI